VPKDHFFVGNASTDLAECDIDADGDPPVAVTNTYDGNVVILRKDCPIGTYRNGKMNSHAGGSTPFLSRRRG